LCRVLCERGSGFHRIKPIGRPGEDLVPVKPVEPLHVGGRNRKIEQVQIFPDAPEPAAFGQDAKAVLQSPAQEQSGFRYLEFCRDVAGDRLAFLFHPGMHFPSLPFRGAPGGQGRQGAVGDRLDGVPLYISGQSRPGAQRMKFDLIRPGRGQTRVAYRLEVYLFAKRKIHFELNETDVRKSSHIRPDD